MVGRPAIVVAGAAFSGKLDPTAGRKGLYKQGSSASGKWRSLAGLLPGGGLKAGPPLDPPRPSIISPFPSAQGAGDTCARARPESVIFVVRELYGVGLRPSFSSGDCCTTRRMSAQHKFELESVGLRPRIGRPGWCRSIRCAVLVASGDELEHLSQAGGGAMNSSTSHRPAAAR